MVTTKTYFVPSEYNKTGQPMPEDVVDKILIHHILQMNIVREDFGKPIAVSLSSGYRPHWYEKEKGRSGLSEHCFKAKGAGDYTVLSGGLKELERLYNLMLEKSTYTRICIYRHKLFIHADHKPSSHRKFEADKKTNAWKRA